MLTTVASVQGLAGSSAASTAGRFEVAAMPPKAIRTAGDAVFDSVATSQTAEMSWSKRFEIL